MLDDSSLPTQLYKMFGMSDKALTWFSSYLSAGVLAVNSGQWLGLLTKLASLWGSLRFSLGSNTLCVQYIQPLSEVISHSRCRHHKFADAQHHLSSTPSDFHSLIADVEQCVDCQEMDDW